MSGRCDAHVGEQYPPRCSACSAMVKSPVMPQAPVGVPVWAKTIDNNSEGEASK